MHKNPHPNAGNGIKETLYFKIFLGSMPPDPPRGSRAFGYISKFSWEACPQTPLEVLETPLREACPQTPLQIRVRPPKFLSPYAYANIQCIELYFDIVTWCTITIHSQGLQKIDSNLNIVTTSGKKKARTFKLLNFQELSRPGIFFPIQLRLFRVFGTVGTLTSICAQTY